jgi:hypothetical protein
MQGYAGFVPRLRSYVRVMLGICWASLDVTHRTCLLIRLSDDSELYGRLWTHSRLSAFASMMSALDTSGNARQTPSPETSQPHKYFGCWTKRWRGRLGRGACVGGAGSVV